MTFNLYEGSKFLYQLEDCKNTLHWLEKVSPVALESVPDIHKDHIKQLERLGIVFRRNKSIDFRKRRLEVVLEREAKRLNVPCPVEAFIG